MHLEKQKWLVYGHELKKIPVDLLGNVRNLMGVFFWQVITKTTNESLKKNCLEL